MQCQLIIFRMLELTPSEGYQMAISTNAGIPQSESAKRLPETSTHRRVIWIFPCLGLKKFKEQIYTGRRARNPWKSQHHVLTVELETKLLSGRRRFPVPRVPWGFQNHYFGMWFSLAFRLLKPRENCEFTINWKDGRRHAYRQHIHMKYDQKYIGK
jgi:hypothetical protein